MKAQSNKAVAYLLERARNRGVSMTRLAELCGFSRTTLYRLLRGESVLGAKEIDLFSEALELSGEEKAKLY